MAVREPSVECFPLVASILAATNQVVSLRHNCASALDLLTIAAGGSRHIAAVITASEGLSLIVPVYLSDGGHSFAQGRLLK